VRVTAFTRLPAYSLTRTPVTEDDPPRRTTTRTIVILRDRQEISCSFVILSEAKNLASRWAETLRFAQGDKAKYSVS